MMDLSSVMEDFNPQLYLETLISIAQTDGVKSVEREFIKDQARVLGIDVESLWKKNNINLSTAAKNASKVTRRILVRDCIILASIDLDYTENERAQILAIAEQLDVSAAVVEKLEAWLEKYKGILTEIQVILEE